MIKRSDNYRLENIIAHAIAAPRVGVEAGCNVMADGGDARPGDSRCDRT